MRLKRYRYIPSIEGEKRTYSHSELLNKEINGVIDHADNSITDSKIRSVSWSKVDKSGSSISDLADVNIINQQLDQVLAWDGNKWINKTFSSGTGSSGIYVNVKDFGAVGDGATDDTVAVNNAINALHPNGGVVYFPPGKYKLGPISINKNNLTFMGEGGYLSDLVSKPQATTLVQRSASVRMFVLERTSERHLNGFRIMDLALEQHSANASVPLIDSLDFAKKDTDDPLETPAIKGFIFENLTIFCKSANTPLIRIYNSDINPVIRNIRINGLRHRAFELLSNNHNSGNIIVENITAGVESLDTVRVFYINAIDSNFTYGSFKHIRSFASNSDSVVNNYIFELYAQNGKDIRHFSFDNIRSEETPIILMRTSTNGLVYENWFRNITYRDRRTGTALKKGIVFNDIGCKDNIIYNGKFFRGFSGNANIHTAIVDNGINNTIYLSDIIFENVDRFIAKEDGSAVVNSDKYVHKAKHTIALSTSTIGFNTITLTLPSTYNYIAKNISYNLKTSNSNNAVISMVYPITITSTSITFRYYTANTGSPVDLEVYLHL